MQAVAQYGVPLFEETPVQIWALALPPSGGFFFSEVWPGEPRRVAASNDLDSCFFSL